MVAGEKQVKAGRNKVVAGITELVTGGSSSFIILFYCVFIKHMR
jgi:hypothetical protein